MFVFDHKLILPVLDPLDFCVHDAVNYVPETGGLAGMPPVMVRLHTVHTVRRAHRLLCEKNAFFFSGG